jgi:hypothetical protein
LYIFFLLSFLSLTGRKWREDGVGCIMRSFINCTLHKMLVIKSRRIQWARHVACMGKMRSVYKILAGKPEDKNNSGDLGIDGWIILE